MQFDTSVFADLADKKVLLLGLGREAQSTYAFFSQHMPDSISWVLADEKSQSELDAFWQTQLKSGKATFTQAPKIDWSEVDFAAVSPGISDQKLMIDYDKPDEIAVITNTDLFFELATTVEESLVTIGVTGTKGKSTTTAAIFHVLQALELPSVLGGNIGVPPLDLITKLEETKLEASEKAYAVLELSSHQLSRVTHSPNLAVVQAVTPEHLDYYPSFDDYLESKKNITRFQSDQDCVFFNTESETAREIAVLSSGMQQGFTATTINFDRSQLQISGQHSVLNLVPAVLIAQQLNFEPQQTIDKLYSFAGLPHRLQLVFESENKIRYFNDSLATTPEATIAAIESFQNPIVLIVGGYDRGLNYDALGTFLQKAAQQKKLRGVVYFPPSGERIIAAMGETEKMELPMVRVEGMAEAVAEAKRLAQPEDVVLLSPASASFGRFKDYADRGTQFANEAKK